MIHINDKKNCCGCGACVQKCPRRCIEMSEDNEGFLYPRVDQSKCVDCGLCEKVCPILSHNNERFPHKTLAAKNPNIADRENSSSGGVFCMLAEYVLEKGGTVYGAEFDSDWSVKHGMTDNIEGVRRFMGSKYVQSRIGETYKLAEDFLKEGRKVLFSGTPCQIAGLNHYLKKEYENLLTVEVICHGVPSPLVWRNYLTAIQRPKGAGDGKNTVLASLNETSSIEGISFRDKLNGWKKYGFVVRYSDDQREADKFGLSSVDAKNEIREYHRDNLYMKGFLNNIYLRPSCYSCKFRKGMSGCDMALGDFWGIQNSMPDFDDDKGCGLVLVYTEKGDEAIKSISFESRDADYKDALKGNMCIERSVRPHPGRRWFYKKFPNYGVATINKTIEREQTLPVRAYRKANRAFSRLKLLFH